jgi:RNA polymerase sigma factor (sigma-70 family)
VTAPPAASAHVMMRPRVMPAEDEQLVAAHRAGHHEAFDAIVRRHRAALERFAARLLGPDRPVGPEDVVQDCLLVAHTALRRDERDVRLRAWLHALVRNRCLDELRRERPVAFDPLDPSAHVASTARATHDLVAGKLRFAELVSDVANLPTRQRHALLRREIDGLSHDQLAVEMHISVQASKNLVARARENLLRSADARDAACVDVRDSLLVAYDDSHRASAHVFRHLAGCRDCREFRAGLRGIGRTAAALTPPPLLLSGIAHATWTLVTATVSRFGLAGPTAKATAVLAAAGLVAGGVQLGVELTEAGQPAPVAVHSKAIRGGHLAAGAPLPRGIAIVQRTVQLQPASRPAVVSLACPTGMTVAGLIDDQTSSVGFGYSPATIIGSSRVARIGIETPPRNQTLTVGTLCKRPDANGSLLASPALLARKQILHVCVRRAYIYETPNGLPIGTVFRHQPVSTIRFTTNRRWIRVQTDAGTRGWVRSTVLC